MPVFLSICSSIYVFKVIPRNVEEWDTALSQLGSLSQAELQKLSQTEEVKQLTASAETEAENAKGWLASIKAKRDAKKSD